MKISELVKRTGVSKETIHYYIREGLLRKPRKSGINAAEYTPKHAEQLQHIKNLRDNYYLPIPIIKKIIKHPESSEAFAQLHNKYFRPVDRLLAREIAGRVEFSETTGMGSKWLERAEQWNVITPEIRDGQRIYSTDDVAIGKLMVDMGRIGFSPKEGYDPEDLRDIADFVREFVASTAAKYFQGDPQKFTANHFSEKGNQFHEMISLFFYHLYRKISREAFRKIIETDNT